MVHDKARCRQGGEEMIWEDMSYNKLDFPFALQVEEEEVEYKAEEEEDI